MSHQVLQYHSTFGYHFIPGLKARVEHEAGGYLIRVNQDGFRSEIDFKKSRTPGRSRALLFGDSYTAGDGVSNKNRYSDELERITPDLEIFNFGLPGTGTDQQYLVFREMAKEIEHDLVIIAVFVENIRRVAARYRIWQAADGTPQVFAKPYFELSPGGELILRQVPVPRGPMSIDQYPAADLDYLDRGGRFPRIREAINRMGPKVKDIVQELSHYQPLPAYDSPGDPEWQLMKAIIAQWVSEITKPVIIFTIPVYQYVEETASPAGYQARFMELASLPGVVIHDPLTDLRGYPMDARREFRFRRDPHLTPAGHRALAASLAPVVKAVLAGKTEQVI